MITEIIDSKTLTKHISCKCRCKFDGTKCKSNQRRNNTKCQHECKKHNFTYCYLIKYRVKDLLPFHIANNKLNKFCIVSVN